MARIVKTKVEVVGTWLEQEVVLSGRDLPPWREGEAKPPVGSSLARIDGLERILGRARYTCDIRLPGMLYCRILRAPHAHARLEVLDLEAATRLPGVVAVLSRENAPAMPWFSGRSTLF